MKKNIRSSSNDHFTSINSPPLTNSSTASTITIPSDTNNINNVKINEIITKRIKYNNNINTNTSNGTNQNSSPAIQIASINNNTTRLDNSSKLATFSLAKSFDSTTNDINCINGFTSNSTESFQIQPSKIIILNNPNTNNLNSNLSNIKNQLNFSNNNSISISSLSSLNTSSACSSSMISPSTSNSSIIKLKNKRKKKEEIVNSLNMEDLNDNCFVSYQSTSSNSKQQRHKSESLDQQNQIVLIKSSQLDSQSILLNKNKLESFKSLCLENDTVQHMKNLDINNDLTNHQSTATTTANYNNVAPSTSSSVSDTNNQDTCDLNFKLNLNDSNSRNYLWNLLKSHSTIDEIKSQFGSMLHDKITFWDLVELKLKFSQTNQLKTTYEIIDDYTMLYSNMSTLLEKIVKDHSKNGSNSNLSKKVIIFLLFYI